MKNNRLYKILSFTVKSIVSIILIISMFSNTVSASSSGTCGDRVKWNLNNGVLTITGKGEMANYKDRHFPDWYSNRDEIVEVIVEKGVTSVGDLAFLECTNLKKVTLADSVTSIGNHAFMQCSALETVVMSKNIKSIGDYAFMMCTSLASVRLYDKVESIGYEAFFNCKSLKSITVPSSVTDLGESVFAYCTDLIQAMVYANIETLPEWTFYGCTSLASVRLGDSIENINKNAFYNCDNLKTVTSSADQDTKEKLDQKIKKDVPGFPGIITTDETKDDTTSDTTDESKDETTNDSNNQTTDESKNETKDQNTNEKDTTSIPNNSDVVQKDVVEDEDGNIISGEVIKNEDNTLDFIIAVIVETDEDWEKILKKIDEYLSSQELLSNVNDSSPSPIKVTVTLKGNPSVKAKFINHLAGKNVLLGIKGGNYSCEINMKALDSSKKYGDFYLEYDLEEIISNSGIIFSSVGNAKSYYLNFKKSVDMPVTIKFPFGSVYSRNYASLYQKAGNRWDVLQSVQMDSSGYACFYLSNYDQYTSYLIALNVEGINVSNVLIPENLYDDYNGLIDVDGNKYTITGVKSKWGISINTFSLIIAASLVLVVSIVGGVMYIMNKRKITLENIRLEVMSANYKMNNNIVKKEKKINLFKKIKK